MKKIFLSVLMTCLMLSIWGRPTTLPKEVQVVNFKEVISKIIYPEVCKELGIEGRVVVVLEIGIDGQLVNHEFTSYPCSDLKEAVSSVLNNLKFTPAVNQNGEAVQGKIVLPVNFQLTI